jgi:biopolymer transport protein TolQ
MPLWMIAIEWSARIILILLIFLSVWSVSIILEKKKLFEQINLDDFLEKLKLKSKNFNSDKFDQAISIDLFEQKQKLEKGLPILGTLGSTTPFIGLLGTILGIIVAFGELSQGKADTNAIMFALAEALILTAVGLFVAIPAVIAFNHFTKKIKTYFDNVNARIDEHLASKE